jgi:hypothetical protein
MKRLVTLLALGLALALAAPGVQAAPSSPFTGRWIGTDPAPPDGDGSTLHLAISGGASPRVTFTDLYGSICVNDGAPTAVFSSMLVGSVTGHHLDAAFVAARCGPVRFDWLVGASVTYHYDAATDTLWDGFVTYHRQ